MQSHCCSRRESVGFKPSLVRAAHCLSPFRPRPLKGASGHSPSRTRLCPAPLGCGLATLQSQPRSAAAFAPLQPARIGRVQTLPCAYRTLPSPLRQRPPRGAGVPTACSQRALLRCACGRAGKKPRRIAPTPPPACGLFAAGITSFRLQQGRKKALPHRSSSPPASLITPRYKYTFTQRRSAAASLRCSQHRSVGSKPSLVA